MNPDIFKCVLYRFMSCVCYGEQQRRIRLVIPLAYNGQFLTRPSVALSQIIRDFFFCMHFGTRVVRSKGGTQGKN